MGSSLDDHEQIIVSTTTIEKDHDAKLSEEVPANATSDNNSKGKKKKKNWLLLVICLACNFIGGIGAPLVQRLYYNHGGNRKWLMNFLQSAGFPIMIVPLAILLANDRSSSRMISKLKMVLTMDARLFSVGVIVGLTSSIVGYMYSIGLFYLPVSTFSLLGSTNLAFIAVFSFLIVKQKFTFYRINAVVLLTVGAVILAVHSNNDRSPGVSVGKYLLGFFITLGSAMLSGLYLPILELAYKRSRRPVNIMVVIQFQFLTCLVSAIFCMVGMIINKDLQAMKREAKEFGLGEVKYQVILVALGVFSQLGSLGMIGVVHCTSSLFTGIASSTMLPITQVVSVLALHESFTAEKGMSLALCLWGFTSYFVGEYKGAKRRENDNHNKLTDDV
ncbi:hypothetical protein Sjap_012920 [Stephania japonica]|uniref:Probable purine permease n=1 Tax=Stephania japonica TaxID=461633 RepID=A0AAP0IYR5_9MAGN